MFANGRAPRTLEEIFVGYLEQSEGCAKEAVVPPPEACSNFVDAMYALGQWHLLTIIIVIAFVAMLIQLTMIALNPSGDGH